MRRLFADWFESLETFGKSFESLNIDISALSCLSGLSLVSGKETVALIVLRINSSPKKLARL